MGRRRERRLQLGPVVGHTDDTSTRIWIQVSDDPARYGLRIEGIGLFQFESTEFGAIEFGASWLGPLCERDLAVHRRAIAGEGFDWEEHAERQSSRREHATESNGLVRTPRVGVNVEHGWLYLYIANDRYIRTS